ncbi:MAG: gliding motility-associated ABC transporter substrate-binding protein GldG [Chitinophagales bacterium]|nr:gliding motility-associated ABC transporter substrate-binding protein GldG [Chitinophagales bacterium]MDW8428688.1 gliding motility-associated ABC transporter substrate-binding protein GldG [Chitinophagales bacterium]
MLRSAETNGLNPRRQAWLTLLLAIGIMGALAVVNHYYFLRIDLTADKRYTLTDSTRYMLQNLDDVVFVRVFLEGSFPGGFRRLATATREMLDEMKVYAGRRLQYEFINPLKDKNEREIQETVKALGEKGLQPANVQMRRGDEYSQQLVIPGALVYYKGREAAVNLLISPRGMPTDQSLLLSLSRLEHQFGKAIRQLSFPIRPRLAFLTGHQEVEEFFLVDLLDEVSAFYDYDFFDLRSRAFIPQRYKVAIIVKPRSSFDEKDKFKLDQYLMNGGRILWMLDALTADVDSVVRKSSFLATDLPLNLEDQLFRYGVRLNPNLVLDLQCAAVPLIVAQQNNQPRFARYPCFYFPVSTPKGTHPIVQRIDAVRLRFASSLDTLNLPQVNTTVLLHSSTRSRLVFTPWLVDFSTLRQRPDVHRFNRGDQIFAVLLEGTFPSLFRNRLTASFEAVLRDSLQQPFKPHSVSTAMIVIADGDIGLNEFDSRGFPLELGYDRFNNRYFDNKDFLINCIDYLAGYRTLLDTRNKTIQLRLLDSTKLKTERTWWQLFNVGGPLAMLLTGGTLFILLRRYLHTRR